MSEPPASPCTPSEPLPATVLIIDDDDAIRRLLGRVVQRFGLQVLEGTDGIAGVDLLRQHHSRVVCAVLDLHMPRISGAGTLAALRAIRPDLPVLLISGDIAQAAILVTPGATTVRLSKPFSVHELRASLQQLLGPQLVPDTL